MRRAWLSLAMLLVAACDPGGGAPAIDAAPIDAALDGPTQTACPPCAPGSICVERYDGVCNVLFLDCVTTDVTCPDNACTAECELALCGGETFQCQNRPPCGTEAPGAFTCYGP